MRQNQKPSRLASPCTCAQLLQNELGDVHQRRKHPDAGRDDSPIEGVMHVHVPAGRPRLVSEGPDKVVRVAASGLRNAKGST